MLLLLIVLDIEFSHGGEFVFNIEKKSRSHKFNICCKKKDANFINSDKTLKIINKSKVFTQNQHLHYPTVASLNQKEKKTSSR